MKDYILLCSGFPPATVEMLREQWAIKDILLQQDALAYLENCPRLPLAAVIGCVSPSWPDESDTAFGQPSAHILLDRLRELDPELPVIVSTAAASAGAIVDLVKRGAFDYVAEFPHDRVLSSPDTIEQYNQQIESALRKAVLWRQTILENRRYRRDIFEHDLPVPICARSPAMVQVIDLARKVAQTPATVLLSGESGTGKEVIARTIHGLSSQADQPFIPINCGAVSDTMLFSELFGHKRGAFTGATSDRRGLLREAAGGTLFLDEIGEVSPAFQVALLRVLENRSARELGGQAEYDITARFLAASNANLEALVRAGRFREDLFYRLNVVSIHLPPLRERREDIPVLANFFLQQLAESYSRPIDGFTPQAMEKLESHKWPGNVRQLRNDIERAVILCESKRIGVRDLVVSPPVKPDRSGPSPGTDLAEELRRVETDIIRQALDAADGNISQAARQLNMKRTTLGRRVRELIPADTRCRSNTF